MKRSTQSVAVEVPRAMIKQTLVKLRRTKLTFSRYVEILIHLDMKKKIVPPLAPLERRKDE